MASKVAFIITHYDRKLALRNCLLSLKLQTFADWKGIVVDNGHPRQSPSTRYTAQQEGFDYCYTRPETTITGAIHTHSLYKATEIGVKLTESEWLCFPNDDSYYCPWFLERMLRAAEANQWDLVYCDFVAGSALGHWTMQSSPRLCCIDKTCFILKREWFRGFPATAENYPQADGLMIEDLVKRGIRHGRVPEVLCVHN